MQVQCKTCNKMFGEAHLENHLIRFNSQLFCNEEGCVFKNKDLETIVKHGQIKHDKIFKNERQLYILNCLQYEQKIETKNNSMLNSSQVNTTQVIPIADTAFFIQEDVETLFFFPDLVKLKLDKISKYLV